jgi:hypothetical protein
MFLKTEIKNRIKELKNIKADTKPVEIDLQVDDKLVSVGEGSPIKFEISKNKIVVDYKGSSIAYTSKYGFNQARADELTNDAIKYFKRTKK